MVQIPENNFLWQRFPLTFSNPKTSMVVDYEEVTVTRRIFRSGESEYLMNKTSCRLKDIQELFMDTGIGTDAYFY